MRTITKKPEVLAPGGTLEKLKTAIHYGADAVYIGGEAYGLRSRAGNFDYEEMAEAVAFAHSHGSKIYVAANMVTHEGNEEGAGEFFRTIRDIGIDAVLISDPALMEIECPMHPACRSICRHRLPRPITRRSIFGRAKAWNALFWPVKYRWQKSRK